ncbi:MAG: mercuric transport protein MerTP [Aequorivita sp.]
MKSGKRFIGLGIVTAISASLCCITPVLALLAGTSGFASTFSWVDPFRPYLIGLTVLFLGFAWYWKLKPRDAMECCDPVEKTPFVQTKGFLGLVTILAGIMLAFPMYSQVFYPTVEKQITLRPQSKIGTAEFKITGMTCSGCEENVNHQVNKLSGIIKSIVSYKNGNAIIEFDKTQTDVKEIEAAMAKTGYTVTQKKEIK